MLAVLVITLGVVAHAELENQQHGEGGVYTSKPLGLRLVVPRGWRASDTPSYPGLLLWMIRGDARIVFTGEPFTRELYCSWPVQCRTSHESSSMTAKFACALRMKLQAQHLRVGPIQAGPKDNAEAGLESVWFEYDDGKHFLRQAVALGNDRAVGLVLSAPTSDARAANIRAFEQALRTLHPLSAEEISPIDAGVAAPPSDAGLSDAAGSATFESAPAAKLNPVGACT